MLAIPDGLDQASTLDAAVAYADHGWYVLPVVRGKHAGSYLGKGWPDKSTRDPDLIRAWFASSADLAIAVHVGASNALAFDVDTVDNLPLPLVQALLEHKPPYQMTRPDDVARGHYLFKLPDGVMFGNSLGQLRTTPPWGDVRGRNGIILVQPSPHTSPRGRYRWHTTGRLPELPQRLGRLLHAPPRPPPAHVERAPHLYVRSSLTGIERALRGAAEGNRNNMLFWAACCVGELASGPGDINVDDVASDLEAIATTALGLRRNEAAATITSGIHTGRWVAA